VISKVTLKTAALVAVVFLTTSSGEILAAGKKSANKPLSAPTPKPKAPAQQLETYKDLIQKAQNLTLQRDRLQTSQVLTRALQRENKNSGPYKELLRALDELTGVFYTDKAQNIFAVAESNADLKPREAIEGYLEALRIEEGNVSILKSLTRAYLRSAECDKAEAVVRQAEGINGFSPEIKLLRLQTTDCQKKPEQLTSLLASMAADLEPVELFTKGLAIKDLLRRRDFKKAKAMLASWESQNADYPELYYWKWQYAEQSENEDRASALKYSQLCQNLTPRKRKSYNLDVDLCKGRDAVDAYLKESGFSPSVPAGGNSGGLKSQ
jgi:hypothetical protein